MSFHKRKHTAIMVLAGLLLAACGAVMPPATQTPTQVGPTRLLAELFGQVVLEGDCLRVLSSNAPGESLLLVFPADFTAQVTGDTVLLSDLREHTQVTWHIGDTVEAFGGYISRLDPSLRPAPADCAGPYFLLNGWVADATPTPAPPATARALTPTPMPPTVTDTAPGALITFTNSLLGITFSYRPSQDGRAVAAWVGRGRVYVYYAQDAPVDGQYVEVRQKAPGESLEQAIQKQIMAGYDPHDCELDAMSLADESGYPHASTLVYAMIQPRVPPTVNANDDAFATQLAQAEKCPPDYTVAGGSAYFMADGAHPDRFFFFKIGQYWIYSDDDYPWQDTLQVIDAQP